MTHREAAPDHVIRVRGLRKAYGRAVAVDGLDLDVPRGSIFGLLGPNGAGKSTTFGMLCGWLRPDAGEISILGARPDELHRMGGRVAALPQDAAFPAHVPLLEQLTHFARLDGYTPAEANDAARQALEQVGLLDAAHLRGSQLSHGMHKRAGLAQTLLGRAEVLLLDEPTSGLDPRTARTIKDRIASLAPSRTILLSSHNLSEVQELCTHGAILDAGRLTISGPIDVLTRRGAEFTLVLCGGVEDAVARLRARWPDARDTRSDAGLVEVRLHHPSSTRPGAAITEAVRIAIDAGAELLEVRRGTSLERAFLDHTAQSTPDAT